MEDTNISREQQIQKAIEEAYLEAYSYSGVFRALKDVIAGAKSRLISNFEDITEEEIRNNILDHPRARIRYDYVDRFTGRAFEALRINALPIPLELHDGEREGLEADLISIMSSNPHLRRSQGWWDYTALSAMLHRLADGSARDYHGLKPLQYLEAVLGEKMQKRHQGTAAFVRFDFDPVDESQVQPEQYKPRYERQFNAEYQRPERRPAPEYGEQPERLKYQSIMDGIECGTEVEVKVKDFVRRGRLRSAGRLFVEIDRPDGGWSRLRLSTIDAVDVIGDKPVPEAKSEPETQSETAPAYPVVLDEIYANQPLYRTEGELERQPIELRVVDKIDLSKIQDRKKKITFADGATAPRPVFDDGDQLLPANGVLVSIGPKFALVSPKGSDETIYTPLMEILSSDAIPMPEKGDPVIFNLAENKLGAVARSVVRQCTPAQLQSLIDEIPDNEYNTRRFLQDYLHNN